MPLADHTGATNLILSLPDGGIVHGAWQGCRGQGQQTCLLPVFFCAGVGPSSAWEREGVPTNLLLPVCTAGEAQAAGLAAGAPGDAFALPCIAAFESAPSQVSQQDAAVTMLHSPGRGAIR